jgi:hypothetical protein
LLFLQGKWLSEEGIVAIPQSERRLAYLLYSCGLQSAEIVRGSPQEWSDVHEVTRLRRIILERERRLASEKQ